MCCQMTAALDRNTLGHLMSKGRGSRINQPARAYNKMKFLGPPSSGSIAGTTSSHNRAGQYTRNRRTPVNPVGTGRRAIARANFSAAAKYYASLTSPQQAAWTTYGINYPTVDSLGQSIKLTGHQIQISINSQLLNVGAPLSIVPPLSNAVAAPVIAAASFVHSTGILTLTLTPSGTASDYIAIAFSKPRSSGTSFNNVWWQQLVVPGNSTGAATYGSAYVLQFGTPGVGQRVFYRLTPINQYGVAGTPVIGFITVT